MDPDDFYKVAEYLNAKPLSGKEDASQRTVASRIYYAAFLFARQVMTGWGLQIQNRFAHTQVAEGLKCSGILDIWQLGDKLSKLQAERIQADYEIGGSASVDFQILSLYWYDVRRKLLPIWEKVPEPEQKTAIDKMRKKVEVVANPSHD